MFGVSNNRFQIPDNPGQQPQFQYLNQTDVQFGRPERAPERGHPFRRALAAGAAGAAPITRSRWASATAALDFMPDRIGDLMFNGVASAIDRSNRASTLQADFSTPLGDDQHLALRPVRQLRARAERQQRLGVPGRRQRRPDQHHADQHPRRQPPASARTWAAYVQDEWSISDKLTVNYGLRGDSVQGLPHRKPAQPAPRAWYIRPPTTPCCTPATRATSRRRRPS